MKILYYSDSFGDLTTTFIRNELDHVAKYHNVKYLCLNNNAQKNNIRHDYLVETIEFKPNVFKKKILWYLWKLDLYCGFKYSSLKKKINTKVDDFKPDIIHLHFGFEGLLFLENFNVENYTGKIILHFHGYDASQMLNKRSYLNSLNRYYKKFPRIISIFVSDNMLRTCINSGLKPNKHFILRYGIDLDYFKPCINQLKNKVVEDEKIFLQVSSLVEKKGHIFILKALEKVILDEPEYKNSLKFIFTGIGSEEDNLKTFVNQKKLNNIVEFVGNKNRDEVYSLMQCADVFVHHSVTARNGDQEGIPNAIIEAMAMELPVLSSNHAGIPELVEHEVNGILTEEKDVNAIAEGIIKLMSWKKCPENRIKVKKIHDIKKHNDFLISKIYKA
jgi:colanic acid/amylovoran biosynthesis glycosyltransferase